MDNCYVYFNRTLCSGEKYMGTLSWINFKNVPLFK